MTIDFNEAPPVVTGLELNDGMSFNFTDASICDAEGNLLFYTNGIYIADATHEVMENGDSINNTGITYLYTETGMAIPQGAIILPAPGSDNLYYVFYEPVDFEPNGLSYFVPKLFYSVVDMSLNGGKGAVIEKDQIIIEDTLAAGKITACKHGNGRDWWILVPEEDNYTNVLYRLLLTPQGVNNLGKQDAGPGLTIGPGSVGNAVFSPDGTKYVKHDIRFNPLNTIDIYDFDHCTGQLQHLEHFTLDDSIFLLGGASISPDSRYLYIVTQNIIYQFDLWADDIEATKTLVAEYDGFVGLAFGSIFATPQLAPDGTIWINTVSDTVMHVIRTPGQLGLDCHVDQHAIHLPKINQKSIPNFPNYRLGPLDGSPCDTLGLNNHPLAGFTWFAEELEVTFSDNSYYRPEEWLWDFGDGNGSTERNPIHTYELPGEYYVCLTVSNEYDSDTFCRWVEVDSVVTGSTEAMAINAVRVFPNPAKEKINIALPAPLAAPAEWRLYNTVGQMVQRSIIPAGQREQSLSLAGVPSGLYFWKMQVEGRQVRAAGRPMGNGKVVVVTE